MTIKHTDIFRKFFEGPEIDLNSSKFDEFRKRRDGNFQKKSRKRIIAKQSRARNRG